MGLNRSARSSQKEISDRFVPRADKDRCIVAQARVPKTESQVYVNSAVVYSNYSYELETRSQRINQASCVTEVFVLRKGQWVNPGSPMDSGK